MQPAARHGRLKWFSAIGALYLAFWLLTTHVVPVGTGGLTGPLKARVYQSETHLVAMYPLYLLERWTRNVSFTDCSYRFGCDFADGVYCHNWLYGDGKYGWIWYSYPQVLGGFVLGVVLIVRLGKLRRRSWRVTLPLGLICSTLAAFAYLSSSTLRMWETESVLAQRSDRPVLSLWTKYPDGGILFTRNNALTKSGGDGTEGKNWLWTDVVEIKTNGFSVQFTLAQGYSPRQKTIATNLIFFPYGLTTATNWQDYEIRGQYH
jgi:hypothetical protein